MSTVLEPIVIWSTDVKGMIMTFTRNPFHFHGIIYCEEEWDNDMGADLKSQQQQQNCCFFCTKQKCLNVASSERPS